MAHSKYKRVTSWNQGKWEKRWRQRKRGGTQEVKERKKWFNQNASLFIYNIEFSTRRTTNDSVDDDGNDGPSK